MTFTGTGTDQITNLRMLLAERRIVRQHRRQMQEELSHYRTPAEQAELYAILGRHDAAAVAEIEPLLPSPTR